jgi:hypothetical protein
VLASLAGGILGVDFEAEAREIATKGERKMVDMKERRWRCMAAERIR